MSLIRVSADNPAALLAVAVLLIVLGLVGVASLPIQMLPNLEYPEININTSWRNAAGTGRRRDVQRRAIRQRQRAPALRHRYRPAAGDARRIERAQ
jgi:multidrug efflux pump subunit AcrB